MRLDVVLRWEKILLLCAAVTLDEFAESSPIQARMEPHATPMAYIEMDVDAVLAGAALRGVLVVNAGSEPEFSTSRTLSALVVCECHVVRDDESQTRALVFDHTRYDESYVLAQLPLGVSASLSSRSRTVVPFTVLLPPDWPGTLHYLRSAPPRDPEWLACGENLSSSCAITTRIDVAVDTPESRLVVASHDIVVRSCARRSTVAMVSVYWFDACRYTLFQEGWVLPHPTAPHQQMQSLWSDTGLSLSNSR